MYPQAIDVPIEIAWEENGIQVSVLRMDLVHPMLSGNKYWKLKYNIQAYLDGGYSHLITFGGAFSNHIYAFAAACKICSIPGIAFIRGDGYDEKNPTLKHAVDCGVKLEFLDRETYKKKREKGFLNKIELRYPNSFIIPEGGSNELGFNGVNDMLSDLTHGDYDIIALGAGTGMTAAGVIASRKEQIEVFSVLKGNFLQNEIEKILPHAYLNWELISNFHGGGYAKVKSELVTFYNEWKTKTGIILDPIYNCKVAYGLIDRIKSQVYSPGTHILMVHTGGLQGINGFKYRNPFIPW